MNVTYKDLLGKDVSYRMYYNRTYLGGETEGDEREEYYSLSGVLLVNGGRYPVEGSIETEEEEGETESELFFRAFIDDTSYIEVKQEYEEETENGDTEREQKYVYSVYRNGALSERTEVEYESEEGGLELKMVVESESGKDELYFEQKKGGSAQLQVHGKINGEQVRFTVYVLTRQDGSTYYRYEFENGADFDDERYGDDDDEDDD